MGKVVLFNSNQKKFTPNRLQREWLFFQIPKEVSFLLIGVSDKGEVESIFGDKIMFSFVINPDILKYMDNLRYTDILGRELPIVYRSSKKMIVCSI